MKTFILFLISAFASTLFGQNFDFTVDLDGNRLPVAFNPFSNELFFGNETKNEYYFASMIDGHIISSYQSELKGMARKIIFSPSGNRLLISNWQDAEIIDVKTKTKVKFYKYFFSGEPTAIRFKNDSEIIVTYHNGSVCVYDILLGNEVFKWRPDIELRNVKSDISVKCDLIALDIPDGYARNSITFLKLTDNKIIKSFSFEPTSVPFGKFKLSETGKYMVSYDTRILVNQKWQNWIYLYDLISKQKIDSIETKIGNVNDIVFFNNDSILFVADGRYIRKFTLDGIQGMTEINKSSFPLAINNLFVCDLNSLLINDQDEINSKQIKYSTRLFTTTKQQISSANLSILNEPLDFNSKSDYGISNLFFQEFRNSNYPSSQEFILKQKFFGARDQMFINLVYLTDYENRTVTPNDLKSIYNILIKDTNIIKSPTDLVLLKKILWKQCRANYSEAEINKLTSLELFVKAGFYPDLREENLAIKFWNYDYLNSSSNQTVNTNSSLSTDKSKSASSPNNSNTNQDNNNLNQAQDVCNLKFTKPQLTFTLIDNRKICCCCGKAYSRYSTNIENEKITQTVNYLVNKMVFHVIDNNLSEEHLAKDAARLGLFVSENYSYLSGIAVSMGYMLSYTAAKMGVIQRPSTKIAINKYNILSNYCGQLCEINCNCK